MRRAEACVNRGAECAEIPWRPIIGMRNRIIHEYWRVNLPIVGDTVQRDLPPLIAALEALVPPEESGA